MRKVVLSIIFLCSFVAVSSAYAASGYKATISYGGNTIGLLVYYDNSVTNYVGNFNSYLDQGLSLASNEDISVSDSGSLDEQELNQIINTLFTSGTGALRWDQCVGVVVYKGAGITSVIRADIYGIQNTSIGYIGSVEINEMLLNIIE